MYEAGDHRAVGACCFTLCTSGCDRARHLQFMTSVPERPAQLLLLQVSAPAACAPPRPPLRKQNVKPPRGGARSPSALGLVWLGGRSYPPT